MTEHSSVHMIACAAVAINRSRRDRDRLVTWPDLFEILDQTVREVFINWIFGEKTFATSIFLKSLIEEVLNII